MNERKYPRSSFIDGAWLVSGDYFYDVPETTEMCICLKRQYFSKRSIQHTWFKHLEFFYHTVGNRAVVFRRGVRMAHTNSQKALILTSVPHSI